EEHRLCARHRLSHGRERSDCNLCRHFHAGGKPGNAHADLAGSGGGSRSAPEAECGYQWRRESMSAKQVPDINAFMQRIPYARFLGITVDQRGNEITTVMHFSETLIGNPVLPALHGGTIGAFLEITAIAQLAFEAGTGPLPKPIGLTI